MTETTKRQMTKMSLTAAEWARLPIAMCRTRGRKPCALCHEPILYGERSHGHRAERAHVRCVNDALKVPVPR